MIRKLTAALLLACTVLLTACSAQTTAETAPAAETAETAAPVSAAAPDLTEIRSICDLATLECYYHNVAKATKPAGKGIIHLGEKERIFWIEYSGAVQIGIDLSQVAMSAEGQNITITLPAAKILSIRVDETSLHEDSYISSADSWNHNKITAGDQTAAIQSAQLEMQRTAQSSTSLLLNAQSRAKSLIENYIDQLAEATGTDYSITWNLL